VAGLPAARSRSKWLAGSPPKDRRLRCWRCSTPIRLVTSKLLPGSMSWRHRVNRYGRKLQSHAANLRQLHGPEKIAYVFRKLKYAPAKTKHKLYRRAYKIYRRYGRPLPPALKNIEEINFAAVKDYEPQTYFGNVTLFLASDLTADYDLHDGWRELVQGDIETHEIPGNHINIIKEPHVRPLAEKLKTCLDKAEQNAAQATFGRSS